MIQTNTYGTLSDGRPVTMYTVHNSKGEYAQLLDYGAAMHSLYVLDNAGALGDVVLGGADIEALQGQCMEGSTIGRCANRIAFGKFELNGKTVQLECHPSGHFLHGASGNYANKLFTADIQTKENQVIFRYRDTGEGGFDCEVDVDVIYTFDNNSALQIEYRMMPYGDTVLCPTNHAYFNLSGPDVREHELMINAEKYAVKEQHGVTEGVAAEVLGTPLDFRKLRNIGKALESDTHGFFKNKPGNFDDSFLLDSDSYALVAELKSEASGRSMHVFTDMPCIVLYTPFCNEPKQGKNNAIYEGYCAVCLETQFVPNAVNCPQFRSPIYRKNQQLYSKTVYQFTVF